MSFHTPATTTHRSQDQGVPRAARQTSITGLLIVIVVLLWLSPLSLITWLVGQVVIARQTRWHWHRFALAAIGCIGLVVLVAGPKDALVRHFFVPVHFWQYIALIAGFGPYGIKLDGWDLAHDLVTTQMWLGIPVGILAAAFAVRSAEKAAAGAEWHPLMQRRQRIDQRARDRKAARLLTSTRAQDRIEARVGVPPLGVALDGDLPAWVQRTSRLERGSRRFVVPPPQARGKGMAIVGAPGSGKTVTLLRLAYLAGVQGLKVCFADCKGTDPDLVGQLISAYRLGNPEARIGLWPQTAMDMWRGTPGQIVSRLLAVEQFTEPFYERVASVGLRLALTAPGMDPVRSSDELLRRLNVDVLGDYWDGYDTQLDDLRAIADALPGARLRYADFFASLGGAFDLGTWSFEDADLAVLSVPTLLNKAEADAAMRVVLEDYGHYATGRKPRTGEDAVLMLDEFSALASGVDAAISMLERLRDVGVTVIPSAQSFQGFGTERQADRLLASCAGGLIVHQCPDPERLLARAGVLRELEQSWNLDPYGPRGLGEVRMGERPRIDADQVRAAQPGEAWVIHAGRAVHMRVIPAPTPPPAPPVAADGSETSTDDRYDTQPIPLPERITAPMGRIAAAVRTAAAAAVKGTGRHLGRRLPWRQERRGRRLPVRGWRPARPVWPSRGRWPR